MEVSISPQGLFCTESLPVMPSPTQTSRSCCSWKLFPFWALLEGRRLKQSRCSWTCLCSSAESTGGCPWLPACEVRMLPPICKQMSKWGEKYKWPERADPLVSLWCYCDSSILKFVCAVIPLSAVPELSPNKGTGCGSWSRTEFR